MGIKDPGSISLPEKARLLMEQGSSNDKIIQGTLAAIRTESGDSNYQSHALRATFQGLGEMDVQSIRAGTYDPNAGGSPMAIPERPREPGDNHAEEQARLVNTTIEKGMAVLSQNIEDMNKMAGLITDMFKEILGPAAPINTETVKNTEAVYELNRTMAKLHGGG
jgi:hypothetical protein